MSKKKIILISVKEKNHLIFTKLKFRLLVNVLLVLGNHFHRQHNQLCRFCHHQQQRNCMSHGLHKIHLPCQYFLIHLVQYGMNHHQFGNYFTIQLYFLLLIFINFFLIIRLTRICIQLHHCHSHSWLILRSWDQRWQLLQQRLKRLKQWLSSFWEFFVFCFVTSTEKYKLWMFNPENLPLYICW